MNLDPKTILQVLVLAVGAHIVLSFLRTSRGSGLVRGVLIALFVVFGGLLGVARWLELAELQYIVETLTGFVVVILAIVFQPDAMIVLVLKVYADSCPRAWCYRSELLTRNGKTDVHIL